MSTGDVSNLCRKSAQVDKITIGKYFHNIDTQDGRTHLIQFHNCVSNKVH